jgi:hypothetical protein
MHSKLELTDAFKIWEIKAVCFSIPSTQVQVQVDDAAFTAEFIEMVDGWFDSFNTGNLLNANELRRGLTSSSPHWEHLKLCKSSFMKLKVDGSRSKIPCISGIVLAINCLEHLYSYLHEKVAFSFLLTNRLNQDCLEIILPL